jgi:hypothetical protein
VKFEVFMGEPEMLAMWNDLLQRGQKKELSGDETEFFDKWSKSVELLSANPRHPGLQTHEIDDLSRKFGIKVWQSYLENRTSGARRIFWAYGPGKVQITILWTVLKKSACNGIVQSHIHSRGAVRSQGSWQLRIKEGAF